MKRLFPIKGARYKIITISFFLSFFLSRSPRATEGMHIFFSYAYVFAYVTVFDLPARGQPHSVFGVCACLARVCLLLALANSLPQRASGSL